VAEILTGSAPNSTCKKYHPNPKIQTLDIPVNNEDLMRTAKVISFSMPPDMEEEVQKIAKEERRTTSELLREAFRQYLANRELASVRKEGRKVAKKMKIKPEDVEKIVRAGRK